MKYRLGSIWLTLALTLGLLTAGGAAASAASFVMVNDGSTTIYHVYVSRASSNRWEYPDVLGQNVLSPGYQTTISFPEGTFDTCYWDIAVVYSDGHTAYDWNEDLCTYGTVRSNY